MSLMSEVRRVASEMDAEERRLLELRKRDAENAQTAAGWGIGIGSILTVAMSLVSLLSVHHDAEELRRTAEQLAEREQYFRLLTENSSDLVRTHDLSGQTTYVSPSVERILGYTPEELLRYAEYGRAKCVAFLRAMDEAAAAAPSAVKPEMSTYEFQLYTLRHHAHHVAQLNLILRQGGATPVKWVNRRVSG